MTPPIKKCDYCETAGVMCTLMSGETICNKCLQLLPSGDRQCRIEIFRLRALLVRAASQLHKWSEKYGEHTPNWLPPSGDIEFLDDMAEFLSDV
jgi:hypothetical protein